MTDRSEQAVIVGERGEEAVAQLLRFRGHKVKRDYLQDWDLLIDDVLTVEVKTANLSGRAGRPSSRFQFCLYSHPARQQPVNEDLLILRCNSMPPCHFIIPMSLVPEGLTKIAISGPDPWLYEGKWADFKECYVWLDSLLAKAKEDKQP